MGDFGKLWFMKIPVQYTTRNTCFMHVYKNIVSFLSALKQFLSVSKHMKCHNFFPFSAAEEILKGSRKLINIKSRTSEDKEPKVSNLHNWLNCQKLGHQIKKTLLNIQLNYLV